MTPSLFKMRVGQENSLTFSFQYLLDNTTSKVFLYNVFLRFRLSFPTEHSQGKTIRLIYAGRILEGETRSLQDLRITNGAVIHSVITETSNTNTNANIDSTLINELDLSPYLVMLCTIMLVLLWGFNIVYIDYFSITSMLILLFLTVLFSAFIYAA